MGLPTAEAATFPEAVKAYTDKAAEIDNPGVQAFVGALALLANREKLVSIHTLNVRIVGARLAKVPGLYDGVVQDRARPKTASLVAPASAVREASEAYFKGVRMTHVASESALRGLRPEQRAAQARAMLGIGAPVVWLLAMSDEAVTERMGFDEFGMHPSPTAYALSMICTTDGNAAYLEEMVGDRGPDGVWECLETGRGRFYGPNSTEASALGVRFRGVVAAGIHTSLQAKGIIAPMTLEAPTP